jgi:hypothetical protein
LDRAPDSLERVTRSLILMAASLVGEPNKVREHMQCSETDFQEYCAARKTPPQPEIELGELVSREHAKIIEKSRGIILEIRARLEKLDGL